MEWGKHWEWGEDGGELFVLEPNETQKIIVWELTGQSSEHYSLSKERRKKSIMYKNEETKEDFIWKNVTNINI